MGEKSLNETARALVAQGKGILAADESDGTIKKRFDSIGVESTEDNRRAYRELLFTTAGRRGVHQRRDPVRRDDPPARRRRDAVPEAARSARASSPGIKVDKGAKPLAARPGETITEGLDGLRERLRRVPRARRAVRQVARAYLDRRRGIPSEYCIWTNAHALARYAALCQEAGLVPIVEPEVLMDGDHTIERCYDVTARVLHARLHRARSTSASTSRARCSSRTWCCRATTRPSRPAPDEVAEGRCAASERHVPAAVPGIVFLSGGQSDEDATAQPQRDERARPAPVAAVVLVRPRAAGAGAAGVGRPGRERRGRTARLLPPREDERRRAHGHVRAGDGTRDRNGVAKPTRSMGW